MNRARRIKGGREQMEKLKILNSVMGRIREM
jgi:hypothetical protein